MYHPQTGAVIVVNPAAVPQHRQSGWMLRSEWEANQAAGQPGQEPLDAAADADGAGEADEEN